MALLVEDGTGVANADSYLTLSAARDILTPLGQDLDSDEETANQQLRLAFNDLKSRYRERWKGRKTLSTQPNLWPRTGVLVDNDRYIDSDAIPDELKEGQTFLAYEIAQENELQQSTTNESVQLVEVVGVVKQQNFNSGAGADVPVFVRVNQTLAPLVKSSGFSSIQTVRG